MPMINWSVIENICLININGKNILLSLSEYIKPILPYNPSNHPNDIDMNHR